MLETATRLYGVFQLQILFPVIDATAWSDKQQHRRHRRKKALRAMRTAEENEKKRIAAMTAKGLLPKPIPIIDGGLGKEIAI